MKRLLIITLFAAHLLIGCKKQLETLPAEKNETTFESSKTKTPHYYSDVELNINKNSSFQAEERTIKEGILLFTKLSKDDRLTIVRNLIMDNKYPAGIINGTNIIKKLSTQDLIEFNKIILPKASFTILDNNKVVASYTQPIG